MYGTRVGMMYGTWVVMVYGTRVGMMYGTWVVMMYGTRVAMMYGTWVVMMYVVYMFIDFMDFTFHASNVQKNYIRPLPLSKILYFIKLNDKPRDLHSDFNWIGKCRTQSKGKGGIGICVNSDIKILDDNLINSQCDTFERLWILCGNISYDLYLYLNLKLCTL
jgi:hypothetical protein